MLSIARLYNHIDVLLLVLMVFILLSIALKFSIIAEQKANIKGYSRRIIVLGRMSDSTVRVKHLIQVPGIDYVYVPLYVYMYNGVQYTTYSYRKCKYYNDLSSTRKRSKFYERHYDGIARNNVFVH